MKKPLKVGVLKAFTDFLIAQEPYAKWKRGKKHRTKLGIDEETFRFILGLVDEKVRRIHGKKIRTEHTSYLTNENLLALLFNWLREYRTKASLAIDFNIPDTTVQDYLRKLVDIVHDAVQHFVCPPARIQRRIADGPFAGACLFIDTYPVPLETRPGTKEDRKKYYWYAGGRTQHWAIKLQMALGMDGRVWNTKAGPSSDKKLYKSSTVPQILARDKCLRGVGDTHYAKEAQMLAKIKNPTTKAQREYNKHFERIRSSIEHTNEKVKDFRILKGPYRGDLIDLELIEKAARIISASVNLESETHPIHKNLDSYKN